ncbi:MAG: GntR family transcriptional regulator [Rhodobacter sp.]|nr:GntR family transcriptional regulator [Rhodobacter sp.]
MTTLALREPSEQQDAVAALRAFIDAGSYAPGDRLPPERELIGDLGISRSILRKALDALEREGAIWRHVGKGTFVAGQAAVGDGAVAALAQQLTPVRMIQARLCVEPSLAREAAIHASRGAITRILRARDAARSATTWADYEAQDDLFHRAVAEASDNILLLSLFDQLNHVRRAVAGGTVVRGSARPPAEHSSFQEHDRIAAAIEARDPAAAQLAMRQHIGSVSDRLFGEV